MFSNMDGPRSRPRVDWGSCGRLCASLPCIHNCELTTSGFRTSFQFALKLGPCSTCGSLGHVPPTAPGFSRPSVLFTGHLQCCAAGYP